MIEQMFDKLGITLKDYFLTGSRALETDTLKLSSDESDYDYVTLITKRQIIINYLNEQKIAIEYSCYNGGFKFNVDGKVYNIITAIHIEFMAWREALYILKHLVKTDERYANSLKNKLSRYSLYEQLRATIKTAIVLGSFDSSK